MTRFAARRAVVTGAASGIGAEITRLLLAEGAHVLAADLAAAATPGTLAVQADVSEPAEIEGVIRTAEREFGGVDLLFNNAGIGSTTNVLDATPEEWDRVFAVNVRGTFLGIKYALPGMLDRGHGAIVDTASAAGLVGLPDRAAYCASKGGVVPSLAGGRAMGDCRYPLQLRVSGHGRLAVGRASASTGARPSPAAPRTDRPAANGQTRHAHRGRQCGPVPGKR